MFKNGRTYHFLLLPFISHPASQWLHKRLMATLLCTPGPAHHSQPALSGTNKYTNKQWLLSVTVKSVGLFVYVHVSLLPCSESDSKFPFFRNHWPSILPVTENAQQDPHIPCKKHTHTEHTT